MIQVSIQSPQTRGLAVIRHRLVQGSALRGGVIVLGNFDGFHRGHQFLIRRARALAGARPVGVMSVEPHPRQVFAPQAEPFRLASPAQKHRMAESLGLDFVYEPAFEPDFAALSPDAFITEILAARLGVGHVLVGADFHFGARRAGTTRTLAETCPGLGIGVTVLPLQGGFSSTAVREALRAGDMAAATRLLGRPWEAELTPSGRLSPRQICPPAGSYLVRVPGFGPHLARLTGRGRVIAAEPLPASLTFLDRRA
ncbi:adenylyltransferase/cytidyltransferase family protein [Paracoccus simplex]|uniref:FAD synthase n=1 Tax=Paracoccus simplex TaxID=2086346 RepID=A0ABV7RU46_9RHOB